MLAYHFSLQAGSSLFVSKTRGNTTNNSEILDADPSAGRQQAAAVLQAVPKNGNAGR